jgi:chitodextrinase
MGAGEVGAIGPLVAGVPKPNDASILVTTPDNGLGSAVAVTVASAEAGCIAAGG